jgi:hypothetical protein
MDDSIPTPEQADAINEQMVRKMEERRKSRPERRQTATRSGRASASNERRRICSFCYQPGDHPTPAHCRRALER